MRSCWCCRVLGWWWSGPFAQEARMRCRKAWRSSSRSHVGRRMPFQCVSYRPRPRTHWWPVILATSVKIGGVETSSVVTWYGGDLVAKACRTYCVRPAGRCRGMLSASYGLAQGLQRATVTRGLAAGPERFEGRSRYNSLSPRGRPLGVSALGRGQQRLS